MTSGGVVVAEVGASIGRIACPTLVVTGEGETQLADAGEVWRAWADELIVRTVPGGHFIPEESPDELSEILGVFLAG